MGYPKQPINNIPDNWYIEAYHKTPKSKSKLSDKYYRDLEESGVWIDDEGRDD